MIINVLRPLFSLSRCSVIFFLLFLFGLKLLLNHTLALFLGHLALGSFISLSWGFSRSDIGGRSFICRSLFFLGFLLLGFFLGFWFRLSLWLGLLYLCFLDSWCFLGFALFSFSILGSRLRLFTLSCIFFFDGLCFFLLPVSFFFRWNKV